MTSVATVALVVAIFGVAGIDVAVAEPSIDVTVTYSATRTDEQATDTASSATTITSDEIDRLPTRNVGEALRTVPGVHVIQQGGPGGATTVLTRGANATGTLVLVDGIRLNNPMLGGADLANLTLDGVQRIEVVRGPLGALWGSDAMAGVVQVFTQPGAQMDDEVSVGAGNYGTTDASFSWGEGQGDRGFGIAGSWLQTDGVRDNNDYDGFTVAGRWDQPFAGGVLTLTGRHYDYEIGAPGPTTFPSATDRQSTTTSLGTLAWTREGLSSRDTVRLGCVQQEITFDYTDFLGAPQQSVGEPKYFEAGWQHDWLNDSSEFTLGATCRQTQGDFDDTGAGTYSEDSDSQAVFGQIQLRPDNWRFVAAARWEDHDLFDSETTWRAGATRLFDDGRWGLWSSYGTGYRVPTFNELYFPGSGNADLVPETSKAFEVGLWDSIGSSEVFEAVYYRNEYQDLIEWREVAQFVWQPVNIADASTEGVELSVRRQHSESLSDRLAISKLGWWTDGDALLRRPDWTASYTLAYDTDRTQAQCDITYVGDRLDAVTFPGPNDVASYVLVNLSASQQVGNDLEVWVRANNLLDADYEAAANYPSPGVNFVAGVSTDL